MYIICVIIVQLHQSVINYYYPCTILAALNCSIWSGERDSSTMFYFKNISGYYLIILNHLHESRYSEMFYFFKFKHWRHWYILLYIYTYVFCAKINTFKGSLQSSALHVTPNNFFFLMTKPQRFLLESINRVLQQLYTIIYNIYRMERMWCILFILL